MPGDQIEMVDVGRQTEIGIRATLICRYDQLLLLHLKLHKRQAWSLICLCFGRSQKKNIIFGVAPLLF